jgi:hypothetical protein
VQRLWKPNKLKSNPPLLAVALPPRKRKTKGMVGFWASFLAIHAVVAVARAKALRKPQSKAWCAKPARRLGVS